MTFKIWSPESVLRMGNGAGAVGGSVSMLATGGYVGTWAENGKIYFQRYDGLGLKVGGPVDTGAAGIVGATRPDVLTIGADGAFAITWSQESSGTKTLLTQKFNASGAADGPIISVASSATLLHGAKMTSGQSGGWAVAYVEKVNDVNSVKLVTYDANGQNPTVIAIDSGTEPAVAYLGSNKYALTYRSVDDPTKFKFSVVDGANATTVGTPITATKADIVGLAGDQPRFIVVAEKGAAGTDTYTFDVNGNTASATISIGGAKQDANEPTADITALRGGGYAVAYFAADGPDLGDLFIKVVDANGNVRGPLLVNTASAAANNGGHNTPSISEMADGRLAITWYDPTNSSGAATTAIVDARTAGVTVVGTSKDDIYVGSDYVDHISGNGGNDIISGGQGADVLDGGEGVDLLSFQFAEGGVTASLTAGGTGGEAAGDTYANFENLRGSGHADVLVGDASANLIEGGAGADAMTGGAGDDVYNVDNASDQVIENAVADGVDTVYASVSFALAGFVEKLIASDARAIALTGNALNNTLIGNDANNIINGGVGADTMTGGAGNDTYYVDNVGDVIVDASGNDTVIVSASVSLANFANIENVIVSGAAVSVSGTAGPDRLTGNEFANTLSGLGGNDTLDGLGGNDALFGGDDNDLIRGGDGNDTLDGGPGHDTIYGGAGNDLISCGTGRDIVVFDTALNKRTNVDKLTDFKVADDSFYLENKIFTKLKKVGTLTKPGKLDPKMFWQGSSAHDADDRIIYNKKTGALFYDKDGAGGVAQVQFAVVKNKVALKSTDFFII